MRLSVPVDGAGLVPARTSDARTIHSLVRARRQNRLVGCNMLPLERGNANLWV
jgi:hypothetical protein